MTHAIDCFVPHMSAALRNELSECAPISNIYPIYNNEEDLVPFIPIERNLSTEELKSIAERCSADYILL